MAKLDPEKAEQWIDLADRATQKGGFISRIVIAIGRALDRRRERRAERRADRRR